MSDVIQFPTKIIRSRSLIEKSIREILDQTQADEDSKNEIIKRSLDIWDKYQCNFSFPVVLPENGPAHRDFALRVRCPAAGQ